MPKVYYQIKKLREIWMRATLSPQRDEMISIFNDYIKELEEEYWYYVEG